MFKVNVDMIVVFDDTNGATYAGFIFHSVTCRQGHWGCGGHGRHTGSMWCHSYHTNIYNTINIHIYTLIGIAIHYDTVFLLM